MSTETNGGAMESKALRPYTEEHAREIGLPSPEAMNLLAKFVAQIAGSSFLPKGLSGHPANLIMALLTGREMEMSPMEALRSYWVSPDGRLAMYADAMMARMRRNGFTFPEKEFTTTRAFLKGVRSNGEEYASEFTMADAERAGLAGKGVWKQYPNRMLRARVVSDVYRFLGADLGGTQIYTPEEVIDMEPDVTAPENVPVFAVGRKEPPAAPQTAAQPEPETPTTPVEEPPAETNQPPVETIPPEPETPAPVSETPAPEPPKPETPPDTVPAMIEALKAKIGGKPNTAQTLIGNAYRGYCGLTDKLKPGQLTMGPLLALWHELERNPKVLEEQGATELGRRLAGKTEADVLTAYFDKLNWNLQVRGQAQAVIRSRGYKTAEAFIMYANACGLPGMDGLDVYAFLTVAEVTKEAWKLTEIASQRGIPVRQVATEMLEYVDREKLTALPEDAAEAMVSEALAKVAAKGKI